MFCFVHTLTYSGKRLRYYVKKWVILSMKHVNLSIQSVIMLNECAVLSIQCLFMFKDYVIMLQNSVILPTKHVNLSKQSVIMLNGCAVYSTQYLIMLKSYMLLC